MSAEDEKSEFRIPNSEFGSRLIIFTRYPEPGKTKTRLIPALGPEGAADLHRRMSEQTMNWARHLQNHSSISIEVRYEGGNESLFRQWLGPDLFYQAQGEGDLGERMARAFAQAFESGMERVILVGTDIPGLNEGRVQKAFEKLQDHELVLGPAKDGGYYLIGLCWPMPLLFRGVAWGTSDVFSQTLKLAQDLNLKVYLLEPLQDVDGPEDLPVWEKFGLGNSPPPSPSPSRGEGVKKFRRGPLTIPSPARGEGKLIEIKKKFPPP